MTHKVLLVEDSQQTQLIVCAALKRKYQVKAVSTSAEALQELKNNSFSLIRFPPNTKFRI